MNKFKILPKNFIQSAPADETLKKAVVIAHLFYVENFSRSMEYLRFVPQQTDVFVITADPALYDLAEETAHKESLLNFHVMFKQNRGRDFGALLIAAKEVVASREVICFVHDKKSHQGEDEALGLTWERCLFEAVLASEAYIRNIVSLFETDRDVGILSAPIPPEPFLLGLRGKTWTTNYENAEKFLNNKLGINMESKIYDDPLTIGSAFWFRRDALKPLFDLNLTYDAFPPEPMPADATFAHILERVPADISRAAGFDNYYVMNDEYAEYYLSLNDFYLTRAISVLRERKMLRYNGEKTDMDMTYDVARGGTEPSGIAGFCAKFRKISVVSSLKTTKLDRCVTELKKCGVIIKHIYNYEDMDMSLLVRKLTVAADPMGILVCVCPEAENFVKSSLQQAGLEAFYYRG